MDKLRVGVIVDLQLHQNVGGTYSFYQTLLKGINEFEFDESIEIVNVVFFRKDIPKVNLQKPVIFIKGSISNRSVTDLSKKVKISIRQRLRANPTIRSIYYVWKHRDRRQIIKQLSACKIDLVYYLKPEHDNLDYPFITSHWDIAHKSTYAFPEVSFDGIYEDREKYYSTILNKASLILCESEEGAIELKKYYSFNPKKIKVLPIFGNSNLKIITDEKINKKVLADFQLTKNRYFFYPAQFWAHKNHYNLIIAFNHFKSDNEGFKLVLSGTDHGNLNYIKDQIDQLALNTSVIITGFVTEEVISALYTNAAALVMPTFLGPTNMPLIEAALLRCPVLCSNLDGHKEIMGLNAIYFEPEDANSIESALKQISSETLDRAAFIELAFIHIKQSKFNLDKSLIVLNDLLLKIKPIRKTWGNYTDKNSINST